MSRLGSWFGKLGLEVRSICRTGSTRRKYAERSFHGLERRYESLDEQYFRPSAKRRVLSHNTLFEFSGLHMMIDEIRHSVKCGDFVEAHRRIDVGHNLARQIGHLIFEDEMRAYARDRRGKRDGSSV